VRGADQGTYSLLHYCSYYVKYLLVIIALLLLLREGACSFLHYCRSRLLVIALLLLLRDGTCSLLLHYCSYSNHCMFPSYYSTAAPTTAPTLTTAGTLLSIPLLLLLLHLL
jgi:hypothetical protein